VFFYKRKYGKSSGRHQRPEKTRLPLYGVWSDQNTQLTVPAGNNSFIFDVTGKQEVLLKEWKLGETN